jgi:hypothetical protein
MSTEDTSAAGAAVRLLVAVFLLVTACGATPPQTPDDTPTPPQSDAPPASAGHSLVYANHAGMVVLVNAGLGGMTSPTASTPTRIWGWTGTAWRLLDSSGPPVRNLGGVAYDSRRNVLVLFGGGYDATHIYGDTWEWNGTWRQITGDGPEARDHTQMAYDADRGRVVLFGGSGTNPNVAFGETWEFDGTRWQRAATSGPTGRVHHALQYDAQARRTVMYGGFVPGSAALGETWTWNGTTWAQSSSGPARSHLRMAFHGRLGALLAFGGFSGPDLNLLARQGEQWTSLAASGGPGARYLADAAYDPQRQRLVFFGGGDPAGSALFAETWEFDGTTWTRVRQ